MESIEGYGDVIAIVGKDGRGELVWEQVSCGSGEEEARDVCGGNFPACCGHGHDRS